jgi:hypothetical protein
MIVIKSKNLQNVRKYGVYFVLRFRTGVISAVRFRKNENMSSGEKISNLKNDILNRPKHIFGCRDQCPSYFCNGPKTDEENFKNSEVFSDFNRHLKK